VRESTIRSEVVEMIDTQVCGGPAILPASSGMIPGCACGGGAQLKMADASAAAANILALW
jgi:hypothetical protein